MQQVTKVTTLEELDSLRAKVAPLTKAMSEYKCVCYGDYVYNVLMRTKMDGTVTVRDIKVSMEKESDIDIFLNRVVRNYSVTKLYTYYDSTSSVTVYALGTSDIFKTHIIYLSLSCCYTPVITSLDRIHYSFYKLNTITMPIDMQQSNDINNKVATLTYVTRKVLTEGDYGYIPSIGYRKTCIRYITELIESGWKVMATKDKEYVPPSRDKMHFERMVETNKETATMKITEEDGKVMMTISMGKPGCATTN